MGAFAKKGFGQRAKDCDLIEFFCAEYLKKLNAVFVRLASGSRAKIKSVKILNLAIWSKEVGHQYS